MTSSSLQQHIQMLDRELEQRIVFLDGAMGTMIQQYHLQAEDYHRDYFEGHSIPLKGNHDVLSLTKPEVIEEIHRKYIQAGSEIICTNTFSSTGIGQADFGLEHHIDALNQASCEIARKVADESIQNGQMVWVAGAVGPTNRTASLSPDVENPGFRNVSFLELQETYHQQMVGLMNGGVDLILAETIFDTLNAKALIYAYLLIKEEHPNSTPPLMISVTITDLSGRTLAGQTVEAFWNSIMHARPLSVGINCALGAKDLKPFLRDLAKASDVYMSCYPNAGLPNPMAPTGYDETPEITSKYVRELAEDKLVNLVGGCCGTTPEHIAAIIGELKEIQPRRFEPTEQMMRLSGLEPLNIVAGLTGFLMVGERANVTGSPKFRRVIQDKNWDEAIGIARQQVNRGANILDINFDDGMLDGAECMKEFLYLIAGEPDVCTLPFMIDSSDWKVIEAGLACVQGRPIVNSISLKDGESTFLERAKKAYRYGAAVKVMAFDEKGQAASAADKVRICSRAYKLLVEKTNFRGCDIIFDANILTVATGMAEHNHYAVDFIEAVKAIKVACPGVYTSGGVSNLSFSFRGNNVVREAMHAIFLESAIANGFDMGIVNAGMLQVVDHINPELRKLVSDVVFDKHEGASEALVDWASKNQSKSTTSSNSDADAWRKLEIRERMKYAMVQGLDKHAEDDAEELLQLVGSALQVIEGPLMDGMKEVGNLFGAGKMFLPQVVKSARVMKKAVGYLTPLLEAAQEKESKQSKPVFVIATVKGDVHDIGKNIVAVVLRCNGYEVLDLGVMVRGEVILEKAKEVQASFIGLSGLITPSLEEMIDVAKLMKTEGFTLPLLIGGATTSKAHTAVKISPHYDHPVVYVSDASLVAGVCQKLLSKNAGAFIGELTKSQQLIRDKYANGQNQRPLLSFQLAKDKKPALSFEHSYVPQQLGVQVVDYVTVAELEKYIDWSPFFWTWGLSGLFPNIFKSKKYGEQAVKLYEDAVVLLRQYTRLDCVRPKAVVGLWAANRVAEDIHVYSTENRQASPAYKLHFLRQQVDFGKDMSPRKSLADYIATHQQGNDYIGGFALTSGAELEEFAAEFERQDDDYNAILVKSVADRLAEAFAEYLHEKIRKDIWGYASQEDLPVADLIKEQYQGIRPAPGYPACPDHSEKHVLWEMMDVSNKIGVELTETGALTPQNSICGYYFSHPESKYFRVGKIGTDQLEDYAVRKRISSEAARRWLNDNLA